MLKYLPIGSIEFLTGSRIKARHSYNGENLLKPVWPSRPGEPLYLTDFKSIEKVTSGPFNLIILAKCTLENGEVALARMGYSLFEVIYTVTTVETNSPSTEQAQTFPKSYVSLRFFIAFVWLYAWLAR